MRTNCVRSWEAVYKVVTCYGIGMDVGIKDAKAWLSRLIKAALGREPVAILHRGEPLLKRVPAIAPSESANRGYGSLRGVLHLPDGWDSVKADEEVLRMFED